MINVGIAGTLPAIKRHIDALNGLQDIRITSCWIIGNSKDAAIHMETGSVCSDPDQVIGKSEVLILTDAGNFSNLLAATALKKARHVFLYPTVISSINEVYQLIKLAREANVILKCGRTGNAGINGLLKAIPELRDIAIIEFQHCINHNQQVESDLLFNLLLGDIEIINYLVHARNTSIKAKGLAMLSSHPEIISARLEFDNGCAVNYYSNTLAMQNDHHITIVLKDSLLKYSFITNELSRWLLKRTFNQNENPIFIEKIQVESTDSLCDDLSGFINLIRSGPAFLSIYDNGFEPLVLADRINEKIQKTLVQYA
jgi:predicted dehydrogenase